MKIKNYLKNTTCKKFLQVQKEGNREVKRNIDQYNIDMFIALTAIILLEFKNDNAIYDQVNE